MHQQVLFHPELVRARPRSSFRSRRAAPERQPAGEPGRPRRASDGHDRFDPQRPFDQLASFGQAVEPLRHRLNDGRTGRPRSRASISACSSSSRSARSRWTPPTRTSSSSRSPGRARSGTRRARRVEAGGRCRHPRPQVRAASCRPAGSLRMEARELGWTRERLTSGLTGPGSGQRARQAVSVEQVLDELSASGSAWTRADVLRAHCDITPAPTDMSGQRWAAALDRAVDRVLEHCLDLDPASDSRRRTSDSRSVWLAPIARQWASPAVVAEEDRVLTWALRCPNRSAAPIRNSAS